MGGSRVLYLMSAMVGFERALLWQMVIVGMWAVKKAAEGFFCVRECVCTVCVCVCGGGWGL